MNKPEIMQWIEQWEGCRAHVYNDSRGHPTIGIGFNLDRDDARRQIEGLGLDYYQVRAGGIDLSQEQIYCLFEAEVDRDVAVAGTIVANCGSLPQAKQKVVVDMIFNLGAGGFAKFRQTIAAIENQDWPRAAREMEDSRWYHQVGRRAVANVAVMGAAV